MGECGQNTEMDPNSEIRPSETRVGRIAFWGLILVIGFGLVSVIYSLFHVRDGRHYYSTTINSGKELGLAMLIFEQDYGFFPCDETAEELKMAGLKGDFTSDSSNAYARQLIASNSLDTESAGYFECANGLYRKTDGNIEGNQAFAQGEFGFILLQGRDGKLDAEDNSQLPLLIGGGVIQERVVLIRLNNSAETLNSKSLSHSDFWPKETNPEEYQLLYPEGVTPEQTGFIVPAITIKGR